MGVAPMKIRIFNAAIFAACVMSSPASAGASGYQIDPAHDGRVVFKKSFTAPLKQKWVRDFGETVSYPVVAGGIVFVTAYAGTATDLFALNERTGETIWHKSVNGSYATVAYDKGRVFAV